MDKRPRADWVEGLAAAIVERAVLDYEEALQKLNVYSDPASVETIMKRSRKKKDREHAENSRRAYLYHARNRIAECEMFFRGDWFAMLCDLDGELIMQAVRERVENGEVMEM